MKKNIDTLKIIKLLLLLGPYIMVLNISKVLDNDTYWIIKTGEYITNNGVPHKDFLTFHTNMDLVAQQWLSSVIYYKLYDWFGVVGPIMLAAVMFLVIIALMQKLTYTVSGGRDFVGSILIFAAGSMLTVFATTRPHIFTYAIVLVELIMLEKYVSTGKWKYLLVLPVLSVLEVNLHASMWTMLFIMMLPYFANALPIKYRGRSISCCKILPLVITAVAMVGTGFITPYGYKGMSFIFTTSIGNKVNDFIAELQPLVLDIENLYPILLMLVAVGLFIYHIKVSDTVAPLRYHLLIFGTMIMGIKYYKLVPYFLVAGLCVASVYAGQWKPKKFLAKFEDKKFNLVVGTEIIFFIVLFIIAGSFIDSVSLDNEPTDAESIAGLEQIVDVLDGEDATDMVLYSGFNAGGYLEFRGYHPYIDARADSFVKEANHEFDYLSEYLDVKSGAVYYKDFVDKYDFTHLVIEKSVDANLYTALAHDDDYRQIAENELFVLYEHK
ncbi:MAG: hypothetical protein ACI4IN_04185 [Eubacterium sp.]